MAREFFESSFTPETLEAEVIFAAHKEAIGRFEKERIEPSDFSDLYPEEMINKDAEYVEKMEKEFKSEGNSESKKLALILEEVFSEQIELNEWLGPGVTTKKASRYDDIKNGVDEIVEIEEENSINHLAIAVDVTFGTNLYNKFERIKREIDSGELATVKYFESSDGTFKGKLSKVPRIVIGTDKNKVVELAKLWMEKNNKELSSHPVQFEIIDEIVTQLESFVTYAEKNGKNDLVKIFERQLTIAKRIKTSKEKMELRRKADLSYKSEDKVFEAITKLSQELGNK